MKRHATEEMEGLILGAEQSGTEDASAREERVLEMPP